MMIWLCNRLTTSKECLVWLYTRDLIAVEISNFSGRIETKESQVGFVNKQTHNVQDTLKRKNAFGQGESGH